MLDDFTSRYHLQGMTKAEVIQYLGPPTQTDKWDGADLVYVLGNDGRRLELTVDPATGRILDMERD